MTLIQFLELAHSLGFCSNRCLRHFVYSGMRIASLSYFFSCFLSLLLSFSFLSSSSSSSSFFSPPPPPPPPPLLLVDSLLLPHLAPSHSFTQTNTLLFSFCFRLCSPILSLLFFSHSCLLLSLPPSIYPSLSHADEPRRIIA